MQPRALIFDFDGTLADTRPHIVRLFNALARRYGARTVAEDDEGLRDLSMRQLLGRLGISMARMPALLRDMRGGLQQVMPEVTPIPGVVEALHALRAAGVPLSIVTSNDAANVEAFAKRHGLPPFAVIVAGSSLFGKARLIKKVARTLGDTPYYVGDESRDIEAARDAAVGVIGVSWGFNSREHLARSRPDFLVDAPRELVELVASGRVD